MSAREKRWTTLGIFFHKKDASSKNNERQSPICNLDAIEIDKDIDCGIHLIHKVEYALSNSKTIIYIIRIPTILHLIT